MQTDEGYIKFQAHWTQTPPFPDGEIEALAYWRQRCFEEGWIGAYPDGIGFGNISCRSGDAGMFLITGSATGNFSVLSAAHFALVRKANYQGNELWCSGPAIASSESMSHAAVYEACPEVNGVIHIHHLTMWNRLLEAGWATDPGATYGSPEMAESILKLLRETDIRGQKIFAMRDHYEGVFAFGTTLEEAFERLMTFRRLGV
ncbi:MAG: hypothetical protein KIPDCIKN_00973 [Haliscomenobacter sp.]|jgi:L-ribulose-5-phosphate 4-epimerase|nr:hypothetical protein [Haliscomenobacter sp.]